MENENVTKAATFKSFLHQVIKTQNYFFPIVLFNYFQETNINTNNFGGLHTNKNCMFPLNLDFHLFHQYLN